MSHITPSYDYTNSELLEIGLHNTGSTINQLNESQREILSSLVQTEDTPPPEDAIDGLRRGSNDHAGSSLLHPDSAVTYNGSSSVAMARSSSASAGGSAYGSAHQQDNISMSTAPLDSYNSHIYNQNATESYIFPSSGGIWDQRIQDTVSNSSRRGSESTTTPHRFSVDKKLPLDNLSPTSMSPTFFNASPRDSLPGGMYDSPHGRNQSFSGAIEQLNKLTVERKRSFSNASSAGDKSDNEHGSRSPRTRSIGSSGKFASSFVIKLFNLLVEENAETIAWTENGRSFVVKNMDTFLPLLGSTYRHTNFSSFVRQLNMYGFSKVNRHVRGFKPPPDEQTWEFSHPLFLRGRGDLLDDVTRKGVDGPMQAAAAFESPMPANAPDIQHNTSIGTVDQVEFMRSRLEEAELEIGQLRVNLDRMTQFIRVLFENYQANPGVKMPFGFPSDLTLGQPSDQPPIYVQPPPESLHQGIGIHTAPIYAPGHFRSLSTPMYGSHGPSARSMGMDHDAEVWSRPAEPKHVKVDAASSSLDMLLDNTGDGLTQTTSPEQADFTTDTTERHLRSHTKGTKKSP